MKLLVFFISFLSTFYAFSQFGSSSVSGARHSQVWVADQGDGTYINPILYADYSDPDVCKVGADFYMTASSFNCIPGLPILHSKDLVNWEIINHAVKFFPDAAFNIPQHGNGIWAPSIRYHEGWFYIYWGDPDRGIYMVKTQDPYGDWSTPILVKKAYGNIDSCPLWDDDGKVYLVHAFANSRAGVSDVLQVQELTPDGENVTRNRKIVINGYPKHPTLEGPKFYKRNGYYYIFAPAGGVSGGWQVAFRSKAPFGPYEDKIVLAQGNTDINGPHQGGYVELDNGEGWFVHFQEVQPYGRIIHLEPVKWADGWPVMGEDKDEDGTGEPVTSYKKPNVGRQYPVMTPAESDGFTTLKLGLQWQWQANPFDHWFSLKAQPGCLRLYSQFTPNTKFSLWETPNLLLQKLPAPSFEAITKVDVTGLKDGERAGLIMMGMDYATVYLKRSNNKIILGYAVCENAFGGKTEHVSVSEVVNDNIFWLSVSVKKGGVCQFTYSPDGKEFQKIGEKFQAVEGRWIGSKVGIYSQKENETGSSGYADFDWFNVEELNIE